MASSSAVVVNVHAPAHVTYMYMYGGNRAVGVHVVLCGSIQVFIILLFDYVTSLVFSMLFRGQPFLLSFLLIFCVFTFSLFFVFYFLLIIIFHPFLHVFVFFLLFYFYVLIQCIFSIIVFVLTTFPLEKVVQL